VSVRAFTSAAAAPPSPSAPDTPLTTHQQRLTKLEVIINTSLPPQTLNPDYSAHPGLSAGRPSIPISGSHSQGCGTHGSRPGSVVAQHVIPGSSNLRRRFLALELHVDGSTSHNRQECAHADNCHHCSSSGAVTFSCKHLKRPPSRQNSQKTSRP